MINQYNFVNQIKEFVEDELPTLLESRDLPALKTCSIGTDYINSGLRKPAILLYPVERSTEYESERLVEHKIKICIGCFINGSSDDKTTKNISGYMDCLTELFLRTSSLDDIYDISDLESIDNTTLSTAKEKAFTAFTTITINERRS
ncbi:MAG: hypothetical protein WCS51_03575 [Bacilli bacterium]